MQTSTAGLMAIVTHEAIVLTPYLDSKGVWTIGIGHTAAAGYPDPKTFAGSFTVREVFGLFRQDIMKYEKAVNAAIKVPLHQHEFDALVSFHFNTGAIARASLTKSINAGNKAKAAKEFMNWSKPKEIIGRRTEERDLFATGKYPAPFATIYPATKAGAIQWSKGRSVDLRKEMGASAAPEKPVEAPEPPKAPIPEPKPQPAPAPAPVARTWWQVLLQFIIKLIRGGR